MAGFPIDLPTVNQNIAPPAVRTKICVRYDDKWMYTTYQLPEYGPLDPLPLLRDDGHDSQQYLTQYCKPRKRSATSSHAEQPRRQRLRLNDSTSGDGGDVDGDENDPSDQGGAHMSLPPVDYPYPPRQTTFFIPSPSAFARGDISYTKQIVDTTEDTVTIRDMKPKGGYAPLNTLDQEPHRPKTGKNGQLRKGAGEMQLTQQFSACSPNLTAEVPRLPQQSLERPRSSPDFFCTSKRRKIDHQASGDDLQGAITIADDGDVNAVAHRLQPSNTYESPYFSQSSIAQSRRSIESESSFMAKQPPRGPPISSFDPMSNMRKLRKQRRPKSQEVIPIDVEDESLLHEHTSTPLNNPASEDKTAPDYDLGSEDELQIQGLSTSVPKPLPVQGDGRSRINSSTDNRQLANTGHPLVKANVTGNLRHIFSRTVETNESLVHDDEADELAPTAAENPHVRSPSKRLLDLSTVSTARKQGSASVAWPLVSAKSYDFDESGPVLFLRHDSSVNGFRIETSRIPSLRDTCGIIEKAKVLQARCDDSRVRILGTKTPEGKTYWFDLEFSNTEDLAVFRDTHLALMCNNKRVYKKTPEEMSTILNKPPVGGTKMSVAVDQELELLETRVQKVAPRVDQSVPKRTAPLISQMKGARSESASASLSALRPVRSSRSKPDYVGEVSSRDPPKEIERFSVVKGLGKPWTNACQYNIGRRRATVEFSDLERLDEGEWLNDALVEFYTLYLFDQAKVPPNKVYLFNTHFFTRLTSTAPGQKGVINYEAVKRWAKEDIFSYDYIIVPVNEGWHWYLAIICNAPNIARKALLDGFGESSPAHESSIQTDITGVTNGTELAIDLQDDSVRPFENGLQPADVDAIPAHDADENLFEEENRKRQGQSTERSTLDASHPSTANGVREGPPTANEASHTKDVSSDDTMPKVFVDDELMPTSSARKAKRKTLGKKHDPDEPIIIFLDSLEGTHPKAVKALKDYIYEEGREKRQMDAKIAQNAMYVKNLQIPTQQNLSDCGLYLLGYLEKFFANPRDFATKILMREMRQETDWAEMNPSKMRNTMREILLEMGRKQDADKKQARREKKKQLDKRECEETGERRPTTAITRKVSPKVVVQSPAKKQTNAQTTTVVGVDVDDNVSEDEKGMMAKDDPEGPADDVVVPETP